MRTAGMLTAVVALVIAWVAVASGVMGTWLTDGVRVGALLILPAAIAGVLLTLYFDWRGRLMRRVLAESGRYEDVEKLAA